MSDDDILDEDFVRQAAQLQGLGLAAAHVPGVLANLRLIARLSQPVLVVDLDPADEPAPVWTP
ncbi:MAG: DUF4089 domain-containing protein [Burkholderiales bacterium]